MTVVEYFDSVSIENITTALFYPVDKIIFIGTNEDKIKASIKIYRELFGEKLNVKFDYLIESDNNLWNIVNLLEKTVAENDEVVFDLQGGKELFFIAAGIVYNNNKQKVRLQLIDINQNKVINISDNKILSASPHTYISVEENVKMYGGDIVEKADKKWNYSSEWDYTEDLFNDIQLLWKVYEQHYNDWTEQLKELKILSKKFRTGPLSISVNKSLLAQSPVYSSDLLSDLSACGAILNFKENKNILSFRYKNENIKDLLGAEGNILETYVTMCAKKCKDKLGKSIFSDVRTGVVISWNDLSKSNIPFVTNEIDVVLMKGLTPVFISCKCGTVNSDELYKLNSVALEFGNKYVKKVLVAASLKFMGKNAYKEFIQRAKELNITVIELDETESLKEKLSKI